MICNFRKDFSFFNDNNIIYFDSASTTIKPDSIITDASENMVNKNSKNYVGFKDNKFIEEVRVKVADFIKCDASEVLFTSSATESINLVAYSYCLNNLLEGDEILLSFDDHKSTILPFLNIQENFKKIGRNVLIKKIKVNDDGYYNIESVLESINSKTKLVVLTHIHNTYGLKLNTEFLIEEIKKINSRTLVLLDASQSIGHIEVNNQSLKADLIAFSGHKMLSKNGVGILYIRQEILDLFKPFIIGGNFIGNDYLKISDIKNLECGTKNFSAINSLGLAIDYINKLGISEVTEYIYFLTRYMYDNLKTCDRIIFNKGIDKCMCDLGYGIISFKINNCDSMEVGEVLKDYNIFVRTGDFCNTSEHESYIRVSLYIYNTKEEIDMFIKVIKYLIKEVLL